jgi:hypothetical protein
MKRTVLPIFLATLWISISEFLRNEILFKSYWTNHYDSLHLKFPSEPINGAMWGVWSLCLSIGIFILSRKFNLLQTAATAWFFGFVMMWVVIGNLSVLPFALLPIAIPLSVLETVVASWIIKKLS